jgi:hypothetical protein
VSKTGDQTLDTDTNTIAIALSVDPSNVNTLAQIKTAFQAGLTTIALENGVIVNNRPNRTAHFFPGQQVVTPTFNPLNPLPVAAGRQCYPGDISDADAAISDICCSAPIGALLTSPKENECHPT